MPDTPPAGVYDLMEVHAAARRAAAPHADVHRRVTPEEALALIEAVRPAVELTLVVTGHYTGPTRGRMVRQTDAGIYLLTERDGLFLVPWGNLAFLRFL